MDYYLMEPPKWFENFKQMTHEQAHEYLAWYISEIPKRLDMLMRFYDYLEGAPKDIFDYSRDSLIPLWSWYLDHVNIVPKSRKELREIKKRPAHVRPFASKTKVELGWKQVALDIGIYFALCLQKYSSKLHWGVQTEPADLMSVNRPVTLGFVADKSLDANNIMRVHTSKIVSGISKETALAGTYDAWTKFIRVD